MNIRVGGALFQIRVSEEMVSSEDLLYSEAAASDGSKKTYLTISLVVPFSPSYVEESIFNDQKESPAKSFPGMDGGITTKQCVTRRKQREQIRCSQKAEGDRPRHATEENSRDMEYTGDGVYRANISEGGSIFNYGTSRVRSRKSSGLRVERERIDPSKVGSSVIEQKRPTYQEPEGLLHDDGPKQSQSIGQGEAKGMDSIQPFAPGKEPVKLKDKSHRRSKKKTLEDILVLGSQKTRLLMQTSMRKQVKARLNSNKKKPSNKEERCEESGETTNDSQILNRNCILYAMNEQQ
ncbi:hypothetical protein Ancab_019956 [Ancistrocladus abbreviatus]